jgi:hypothetical protein
MYNVGQIIGAYFVILTKRINLIIALRITNRFNMHIF